jgi:hypothetical protein
MLVLRPYTATAHSQHAPVEIDICPHQAERLALAETERERDCPSGAVAVLLRLGEYPLHVGHAVWFDLVVSFIDPWRPGNRGRVARDSLSPVRLSERCSNGPVCLVRRRRPAAVALHLRVQPLKVLRLELVQAVSPDAGALEQTGPVLAEDELCCG